MEEISRGGDNRAAKLRLERVSSFPLLEALPEVRDLAEAYLSAIEIAAAPSVFSIKKSIRRAQKLGNGTLNFMMHSVPRC